MKVFILAELLKYWWFLCLRAMASNGNRKLRHCIFYYNHKVVNEEAATGYELSKITSSYIIFPARLYLLTFPNSTKNWDQVLKYMITGY